MSGVFTWNQYSWHTFGHRVGANRYNDDKNGMKSESDAADQSHPAANILAGCSGDWEDYVAYRLA